MAGLFRCCLSGINSDDQTDADKLAHRAEAVFARQPFWQRQFHSPFTPDSELEYGWSERTPKRTPKELKRV